MAEVIQHELELGLACFCWGIILLAVYDVLRIIRRVVRHGIIAISLQDVLFWLFCLAGTFELLRRKNNGIFRYSVILTAAAGMLLYHFLLGRYVVPIMAKGLNRIKKLLKKIKTALTEPIKRVMIKLCKSVKDSKPVKKGKSVIDRLAGSRFAEKRRILREYKELKKENAKRRRAAKKRIKRGEKNEEKRSVPKRKKE